MRIGRLEIRWLRPEAPHKEPKCECPRPLTDTIHGMYVNNWWHQEPCPVIAWASGTTDEQGVTGATTYGGDPIVMLTPLSDGWEPWSTEKREMRAHSNLPSAGSPAPCTCPPSWEEYMEKIAPEYRHCDNILYGRTCPLAAGTKPKQPEFDAASPQTGPTP